MSVKICQHVKVDGTLCQVLPLDGRHYCHFHLETLGRRMRMARARARGESHHLVLPILEDLNAVQVARMQVMDALASGQLDRKLGGLLLFGLQGASKDLRSANAPRLGVYDPAIDTAPRTTEHPNFEANFGLPNDLDLSQPPEVVFVAEAATAATEAQATAKAEPSEYRSNPWQRVNPEDVELEEILITGGQEAYEKRSAELKRKAWKQIEGERHEIDKARQTVEAARRNEQQWSSHKLKEHYDKVWAEAATKEKADRDELAAMRAATAAQAAARKSPESASAEGGKSEEPQTGS